MRDRPPPSLLEIILVAIIMLVSYAWGVIWTCWLTQACRW